MQIYQVNVTDEDHARLEALAGRLEGNKTVFDVIGNALTLYSTLKNAELDGDKVEVRIVEASAAFFNKVRSVTLP